MSDPAQGRRAAMRYFFAHELPKIGAWLSVVVATRRRPAATCKKDGSE